MDMREMVDKVKNKEPLYGVSSLSPYMQGVAARNSRYSQIFFHAIPWFNLVNHNQVGARRCGMEGKGACDTVVVVVVVVVANVCVWG